MKTFTAFVILLIIGTAAKAQFKNYNNYELSIGYKSLNTYNSSFNYQYLTTDSLNQNLITGNLKVEAITPQILAQFGTDFYIKKNWIVVARGWVMPFNLSTWSAAIGAGYRLDLNYFMRIQPEFRLAYCQVSLPMGNIAYTGQRLTFEDVKFYSGAPVEAFYRNQNISLEPALKMIADVSRRWELRFSASYHIGMLNREGVLFKSEVIPNQSARKYVPFKAETSSVYIDDSGSIDRVLVRVSGINMKAGLGFKFML